MLTEPQILTRLREANFAPAFGRVTSIASHMIEADGPSMGLGSVCCIEPHAGDKLWAEVIAVERRRLLLSPLGASDRVKIGDRVVATTRDSNVAVGDEFAGRAIDALGSPIDGNGSVGASRMAPIQGALPGPLDRTEPNEPLATGIRAIDGLLTLGRGQRIGIFAASGVGKTSLIEQIASQSEVDRVIICLVGERGREVEGLWRDLSSRKDHARFTLVAATSDESAPCRARAPLQAQAIAEHWRSQGEHVLLIIDSVTRLAMALREIGLAAGAPPTVRAYTPNVFAALPRLVERCGALKDGGAISAVMTVLSETDDVDDPIVEVMKSLLDGHLILSRGLAEQGQFPAIDITKSVSRGLEKRISKPHRAAVVDAIALLSAWNEARVMIETGAYRAGSNAQVDRAIERREALLSYCKQSQDLSVAFEQGLSQLQTALGGGRS